MESPERINELIAGAIAGLAYPAAVPGLFDPVRYTMESGGKRIRPQLLLTSYCAFGGENPEHALKQALGIEMFHNFTLLHDDVMDRADMRRGRPTVHRRWSESTAILSGDAMLTLATQLIADCTPDILPAVLGLFNNTAMEIYQGQQLDMEFESRKDVTVGEYMEMIRLKTSVLLACACRMGAMLAGASETACQSMYDYGIALGLAFQLRDDWLDTYGDPIDFGKEIGGDIVNNKKTWLLITASSEARQDLDDILFEDLEAKERIAQVIRVYRRLDLSERCLALIDSYAEKAISCLDNPEIDSRWKEYFTELARRSAKRTH